ncbi:MAG: DUF1385 domain-containing protein [Candidatus Nanoarchaeia archaeon]
MKIRIGGQAVVDGVMMRSDNYISTSVRTGNGKIKTRTREYHSATEKNKILGLPFLRGIIMLFELMGLGFKEMMWASNQSVKKEERLSKKEIIFAVVLSMVIVLLIFKLLPWFLANLLSKSLNTSNFWLNALDAGIKIIILVLYFLILGSSGDVKTLFRYHGAEHKTVACYENKKKLTPKNASKFSRIHPRCGTTFVFIVFVVGLFVYLLIPPAAGFWLNYLIRVLLLPIVAGVAYEIIRLEGKYYHKKIVRILIWPGLQFQRLTTKEPDEKQLEIAIVSLEACIAAEKKRELKNKSAQRSKM